MEGKKESLIGDVNMIDMPSGEYMNASNDSYTAGDESKSPVATGAKEAGTATEDPDTQLTGTTSEDESDDCSAQLQREIHAALEVTAESNFKSAHVEEASVAAKNANRSNDAPSSTNSSTQHQAARTGMELQPSPYFVEHLLSSYPELLQTTSKYKVIRTIVESNIISRSFVLDDVSSYPIDYTQIEWLADTIMACQVAYLEGFTGVDKENVIAEQQEKVNDLHEDVVFRLNTRHPLNFSDDPSNLTEYEEEAGEQTRTKIQRNVDYLLSDPPMPSLPFEEDYAEKNSNDEDMDKIGHICSPTGPLGQALHVKQDIKRLAADELYRARCNAKREEDKLAGKFENDYFYCFDDCGPAAVGKDDTLDGSTVPEEEDWFDLFVMGWEGCEQEQELILERSMEWKMANAMMDTL